MLLAVDVGNTNLTVAAMKGGRLLRQWRLETAPRRSVAWYARALKCPFRKVDGLPTSAIYASVVPPLDAKLESAIRGAFGVEPMKVTPSTPLGLALKVRQPLSVGADRVVNALALRSLFKTPAICIDFGTATTFDCVDRRGDYVGGAILLGPNSAARALNEYTAKLPLVKVAKPRSVIGKDTTECIQAGLYHGYLGMIKEVLAKTKAELGGKATVVATGGLSTLFLKDLPGAVHAPDLTLHGLRFAADMLDNSRA
ncbi:MAG: type III pantothenate kinase [Elusimicrobiota bacterium]|nr:type III pantothenate kinase [Elusimicrobiota bacterium]